MAQPPLAPITAAGPGFDPQGEVYNRLLQNRIVFLGSEVNDTISNLITAQLLYLEGEDSEKDICLYINSPGGSVTAGMAIYDTMQLVGPEVGTICMGLAASFQGQASDIQIQAEQILYVKKVMAQRIAEHTGQPVEQIEADSERDRWFTAAEAQEYGIIDQVVSRRTEMMAD